MEKLLLGLINLLGLHKNVGKMKDSVSIAMLAGLFGTIAMDIFNFLLYITKRSEHTLAHMAAGMIVNKMRTKQNKNVLLGELWHMVAGITLALPMMALFKTTGISNHRVKGGFIGALSWGILYNLGSRIRLYSSRPRLTKTHYSYLLTDILYGVVTAETIKIFADRKIFKENSTIEKNAEELTPEGPYFSEYSI